MSEIFEDGNQSCCDRDAPISPWLLDILVCPTTRAPLVWDSKRKLLVVKGKDRAYRIENGIPILLEEEVVFFEQREQADGHNQDDTNY